MTNAVNGYWKESQSVNKVPISEYSSNATIFHYVLAISTESYKIQDKWPNWLLALQLVVSNASMHM